jgi:hypothetical protein
VHFVPSWFIVLLVAVPRCVNYGPDPDVSLSLMLNHPLVQPIVLVMNVVRDPVIDGLRPGYS